MNNLAVLLLLVAAVSYTDCLKTSGNFTIDFENNTFLKDGVPFRYVSGSIHYFRVHPDDWQDRLYKLKYAGFNVLQTYVEWSSHEPEPGQYDFKGGLDLVRFLNLAKAQGLLVILRPGPYICAERDMGGLPYWLLRENPKMKLRSSDPSYLHYVDKWLSGTLLPLIQPLLYGNGGPIIMVQVENEYGSYSSCDFVYTSHLRDMIKTQVQDKAVLFTTDGSGQGFLKCGKIPDVYATVDFGIGGNFMAQRLFEPQGPLVNSEFYPGWLDHWGTPHQTVDTKDVTSSLDTILAMNASVNMYMFLGGTNFGLKSGANLGSNYQPQPTSYDYDAPLSEAGDPTPKYFAIRDIIKKYMTVPTTDVPKASAKYSYGKVKMHTLGSMLRIGETGAKNNITTYPKTFEELSMSNGLVLYETTIDFQISDPTELILDQVHDRGYIFVDYKLVGVTSRLNKLYHTNIFAEPNATLSILVESLGRVNYGDGITDFKGLTTNVTLGGQILTTWKMTPMATDNLDLLRRVENLPDFKVGITPGGGMALYEGVFNVTGVPMDTFINVQGWGKGIAFINGHCLGRYWPLMGPQVTLYLPHGFLAAGKNILLLLELEKAPCDVGDCTVTLQDTPIIDAPTPKVGVSQSPLNVDCDK